LDETAPSISALGIENQKKEIFLEKIIQS